MNFTYSQTYKTEDGICQIGPDGLRLFATISGTLSVKNEGGVKIDNSQISADLSCVIWRRTKIQSRE
jgi:hypothetical protein